MTPPAKSVYVELRASHLIRHCGVGAIVRGPAFHFVIKDIRFWRDRRGAATGNEIPYVDGLRQLLGISREIALHHPPVATAQEPHSGTSVPVPAVRFPSWFFCSACERLFFRHWESAATNESICDHCHERHSLRIIPYVLVHSKGYLADVPWPHLLHEPHNIEKDQSCRHPQLADIRVKSRGQDKGFVMRCSRKQCGARLVISGQRHAAFNSPIQPWLSKKTPLVPLDTPGEILDISNVLIHSPHTELGLVIPPESRVPRGTCVDWLYRNSVRRRSYDQAPTPIAKRVCLRNLATEFGCCLDEVEHAFRELEKGYPLYGSPLPQGNMLAQEFNALTTVLPDLQPSEDFVPEDKTDLWRRIPSTHDLTASTRALIPLVDRLVALTRLRAVEIFRGFSRMGGDRIPPNIDGPLEWLPAIELFGEGVFFSIDETLLNQWEAQAQVKERAEEINVCYHSLPVHPVDVGCGPDSVLHCVTPRFLLLHSLAHLLIRGLETECGYPAAALRERIYCGDNRRVPMGGILIWTAAPGILGTLGGLSELAEPERFLPLLLGAFERSKWCSLDPVCKEHVGQGPGEVNRAACHACLLLPETSCVTGNILLDRTLVDPQHSFTSSYRSLLSLAEDKGR